jgi:hypothetical protein
MLKLGAGATGLVLGVLVPGEGAWVYGACLVVAALIAIRVVMRTVRS